MKVFLIATVCFSLITAFSFNMEKHSNRPVNDSSLVEIYEGGESNPGGGGNN